MKGAAQCSACGPVSYDAPVSKEQLDQIVLDHFKSEWHETMTAAKVAWKEATQWKQRAQGMN